MKDKDNAKDNLEEKPASIGVVVLPVMINVVADDDVRVGICKKNGYGWFGENLHRIEN